MAKLLIILSMTLGPIHSVFANNFICYGPDGSQYKLILRAGAKPWQLSLALQNQTDTQAEWQVGTLNSLKENGRSSTVLTASKSTYNFTLVTQGQNEDHLKVELGLYDIQTDSVLKWGPSLDCNKTSQTF